MIKPQTIPQSSGIGYRLLRIAGEQYGLSPSALNAEQQRQAQAIAAKEVLLEQAVLSSTEAREVVVPQSQIRKAVEQISARYDSADDFALALEDNQLTDDDLHAALARELLVDAVLTYVSSRIPEADDTEINLFFYMQPEKFHQPEVRTARHILITLNPDFPENTREMALARIEAIHQRLAKDQRRFEEQALKHSECPSSFNGGLLGEVKRGTLYAELEAVLFDMKEGEFSSVIESPIGFHILLCDRIQPESAVALPDIKEKLRQSLTERKRKKFQRQWLKEQMEKHQPNTATEAAINE